MPQFSPRLLTPVMLVLATGCAGGDYFAGSSRHNNAVAQTAAAEPEAPRESPSRERLPKFTKAAPASRSEQKVTATPKKSRFANRSFQELLGDSEKLRAAGDLAGARLACEHALRLSPNDLDARHQLARISDDQGRFAEAERIYISLLHQRPDDAGLLTSLGWSYYLQGRFDESERRLRAALAEQPQNPVALNNLGFVYGARGNLHAAWQCFRAAGTEAQAREAMAMLTQQAAPGTAPEDSAVDVPEDPLMASGKARIRSASPVTPRPDPVDEDPDWWKSVRNQPSSEEPDRGTHASSVNTPWSQGAEASHDPQVAGASPRIPGTLNPSVRMGYGEPTAPSYVPSVLSNSQPQTEPGARSVASNSVPSKSNQPAVAKSGDTPLVEISVPPLRPKASVPAEFRVPEWPKHPTGQAGGAAASSAGKVQQSSAEPARPNVPSAPKSRREAQALAAQLGLNAGVGGLGFSAAAAPDRPASAKDPSSDEKSKPADPAQVDLLSSPGTAGNITPTQGSSTASSPK
ncbi:MAG: tetratricopeptide repeat protein [Planctomycetes bacterium]|nr:tetratricopeptide repeat protein [Planctomycetota bacterium]